MQPKNSPKGEFFNDITSLPRDPHGTLCLRMTQGGHWHHFVIASVSAAISQESNEHNSVIASASVAISREGNETTAHTTKTKKIKK